MLPETDRSSAVQFADRLREAMIERGVETTDGRRSLSLSVGVAVLEAGGRTTIDDLLMTADNGLYQSKKAGKGRYTIAGGVQLSAEA